MALLAALPGWGGMAVLDRSWYGRVLVERVEGFADRGGVAARLRGDPRLRAQLVAEGMVLVKFWLHISDEEQLKRFKARAKDPLEALEARPTRTGATARSGRGTTQAVEDMVRRDEHRFAPWTLVEADSKRYARVKVIETVIAAAEDGMRRHGIERAAL